jgi:PAS domain S-box-containing protein
MSASVPRGLVTAIINFSLDGILAVDSEHRIMLWNSALQRMFGLTRDQVIGRTLEEAAPFLLEAEGEKILKAALGGSAVHGREHAIVDQKTGEEGWYQSHCFPVKGDEGVVAALVIIRDMTEAKWTQYSLRLAQERESELLAELQKHGVVSSRPGSVETPSEGKATPEGGRSPAPEAELAGQASSPAAAGSGSASPPDPMVFDRRAALGYLAGDESLLSEMAEIFADTWPDLSASLEEAVNEGKAPEILGHAQKLKGMVAALGGHRSTWASSELENLAKENKTEDAAKVWGRLKGEVARLLEATASLFKRPAA